MPDKQAAIMNKDYFKEYYHLERKHWWFKARSEILSTRVQKILKGKKSPEILNVGVATGATSTMLARFGSVTSLEYDQACCQFLKEQLNFDVIQGSVTALPFPDQHFDLVCAFDVIEHVEDDTQGLKEMMRVCKPGGNILVTVPAFMSLWSEHDEINHHFRRYTATSLKKLFKNDRGNISYISYFNSILFLPIYGARVFSNLIRRNKPKQEGLQSDFSKFKTGTLNKLLYKIFLFENIFLKKDYAFPAGVSILLAWTKNELGDGKRKKKYEG